MLLNSYSLVRFYGSDQLPAARDRISTASFARVEINSLRKLMRQCMRYLLGFFIVGWLLWATPVFAAPLTPSVGDMTKQAAIELKVSLGNAANELKFIPNSLEFSPGKRYKLVLSNPSSQKHYFTAKDFADNIWSQKVDAGKVEVKGAIHELELKPGAQAEWVFVPIKPCTYELRCVIPGHTEAGMTGTLIVRSNVGK
jgi:uncharacterized cupredoxin-like copper-binding protein